MFKRFLLALTMLSAPMLTSAQVTSLFSLTLLNASGTTGTQQTWPGGQGVFSVVGTFGGGTVTLQFVGPDGSTLINVGAGTTCTAACAGVFYLPRCTVQATITGAAGANLYAKAQVLPIVVQ